MKRICDFIARWMGVLVLLTAIGALLVPEPLASVDMWIINPLLGLIMFGMGLTLNPKDFRIVFSRPKDVLIGCLAQFTVMPFLAWALTKAFALPPDLALGVILVGCCPGGTASNVITYLAKGDLALSVGMTAVSTLLAPLMTPLLTWLMAGTFVDVDTIGMLQSILYVVIAPIVAGLIIQKLLPTFTQRVVAYLPAFSTLMIAVVVALIVAHSAPRLLTGGLLIILVCSACNIPSVLPSPLRWACKTPVWHQASPHSTSPPSRWPLSQVPSSASGTTSVVPWRQGSITDHKRNPADVSAGFFLISHIQRNLSVSYRPCEPTCRA